MYKKKHNHDNNTKVTTNYSNKKKQNRNPDNKTKLTTNYSNKKPKGNNLKSHPKSKHNLTPTSISLQKIKLKFTPIQFYQGEGYLLDETSSKILIEKLEELYKINTKIDFKTPGYKYYKLLREDDIESLKTYEYNVALNYGLNPIWCLWLTKVNETNYTFYLNLVTQEVIYSPHRFQDELFKKDILIEGEILNSPKPTFMMWDLLGYNKNPIFKCQNLTQRYEKLRSIYNFQYQTDHLIDNIKLKVRELVTYDQIKSLTQSNHNYGLIFLPQSKSTKCYSFRYYKNDLQLPIHVTAEDLEKLKIQNISTQNTPPPKYSNEIRTYWANPLYFQDADEEYDNYLLYDWEQVRNGPIQYVGRAILPDIKSSQYIAKIFETSDKDYKNKDGLSPLLPFKCRYNQKFRKWEPFQVITSPENENV